MARIELAPQITIPEIRPLQSERQNSTENPLETLSPREKEVIALIAQGLSNKKIGANLFIAERTVEGDVGEIFNKLNINHKDAEKNARVEAANKYIDQNPDFNNPFDGYEMYESFTGRENEVLVLIGQGLSNKAIAKKLFREKRAVEKHIGNILTKIGYDKKEQNARVVMMLVSKAKLKVHIKDQTNRSPQNFNR